MSKWAAQSNLTAFNYVTVGQRGEWVIASHGAQSMRYQDIPGTRVISTQNFAIPVMKPAKQSRVDEFTPAALP